MIKTGQTGRVLYSVVLLENTAVWSVSEDLAVPSFDPVEDSSQVL